VEIGLQCGLQSRYHDGPVFDAGGTGDDKARPADWFEREGEITEADRKRFYGGRCCDLTIRTGDEQALAAGVKAKERKYAVGMAAHPHLALSVVGLGHNGGESEGATETFRRWAACLTRQRKYAADLVGRPLSEVRAAFALAYATVMTQQLVAYVGDVEAKRAGKAVQPRPTPTRRTRPEVDAPTPQGRERKRRKRAPTVNATPAAPPPREIAIVAEPHDEAEEGEGDPHLGTHDNDDEVHRASDGRRLDGPLFDEELLRELLNSVLDTDVDGTYATTATQWGLPSWDGHAA
jgi:hypothetical protein